MHAIQLYRQVMDGEAAFECNFYDNQLAPSNLVVRKVFAAMLSSVQERLNRLEVEYHDRMIADKLGVRAGEVLRFLGASGESLRENKSGDTLVSRSFEAELTEERYRFFHELNDLSKLMHYRLKEDERDRVVFYFSQYLLLQLPVEEESMFYEQLQKAQLPYKVIPIHSLSKPNSPQDKSGPS